MEPTKLNKTQINFSIITDKVTNKTHLEHLNKLLRKKPIVVINQKKLKKYKKFKKLIFWMI